MTADVVVIGGGIVGAAIARELSKYQLSVTLIEKAPDLSTGTTKANSGILHAGFDPAPGSVKGRANVRGNFLYRQLEEELGLQIRWTGSLVVAKTEEETAALKGLIARGAQNGVPGLALLAGDEIFRREPNLAKDIKTALYAPTAGVISPFAAAIAFAECAAQNGARIMLDCEAEGFEVKGGRIRAVHTNKGKIVTCYAVNAAGLDADKVSGLAGDASFAIMPRRGEYLVFDRAVAKSLVNSVVFPTPGPHGKGVLVASTYNGECFIGPNAQDVDCRADTGTTGGGLDFVAQTAKNIIPDLPLSSVIAQFSGLRAVSDTDDFIVENSSVTRGLVQAAGMQSPGLTAAPAVAEMVAGLLQEAGLKMSGKSDFNGRLPAKIQTRRLSDRQKDSLIKDNPAFGRIVCRCETVSEGEIVAAIHSICGARTVDGVKRRVRAGFGRCQGGFCGPRVAAILARELGIGLTAIVKESSASVLYFAKHGSERI
ncbi:MAG: NAD(P)/FAD-dependent oxidoreductase [Acidaminococcales bacterium]|nr:NAD(P)/FAD-dependent oxidoreductase [Acidaminococcales bacterium]